MKRTALLCSVRILFAPSPKLLFVLKSSEKKQVLDELCLTHILTLIGLLYAISREIPLLLAEIHKTKWVSVTFCIALYITRNRFALRTIMPDDKHQEINATIENH